MRNQLAVLWFLAGTAAAVAGAERAQVRPEPNKEPVASEITIPSNPAPAPQRQEFSPGADGLEVKWSVLAGGGKTVEAGGLLVSGTVGQTSAGWTRGLSNDVHAGFWQNFDYTPCCENRGNVDHQFTNTSPISIADLTYLIAMLFRGGTDSPCMVEADATSDGSVNIADVVFIVAFLFKGGPSPGPC